MKALIKIIVTLALFIILFPSILSIYNNITIRMDDDYVFSYQTPRPFIGGWSSISAPIIDENKIYFCAGYNWDNDNVYLIALDKSGVELWKSAIANSCEYFSSNHDFLAFQQTYKAPKENRQDPLSSSFTYKKRVLLASKGDGSFQTIDNAGFVGLNDKYLYFYRGKDKNLYQLDIKNKTETLLRIKEAKILRSDGSKVYIFTANDLYELQEETKNLNPIIRDKAFSYYSAYKAGNICFMTEDTSKRGYGPLFCLNTQTRELTKLGEAHIGLYLEILDGKVYWPDPERRLNAFSFSSKNHNVYESDYKILHIYDSADNKIIASGAHSAFIIDTNTMQITWQKDFPGWVKGLIKDGDKLFITEDNGGLYALKMPK